MKTFCPTHCFNYTGSVCPYCEADRIAAYSRRYAKQHEQQPEQRKPANKPMKRVEDEPQEVTTDMLAALKAKWGSK